MSIPPKLITENTLETLIEERDDMYNEIISLKNKLFTLENEYNQITKEINSLCDHKWVYTTYSIPFDQKPYQCEVCGKMR